MAAKEDTAPNKAESCNESSDLEAAAASGSRDAQLSLGRQLLQVARMSEESTAEGRQAISWLVKAAEQGSKEATEILQQCVTEKIGVDGDNIAEVNHCINMTDTDRTVAQASRDLFRRLSKDISGPLTKAIYLERIKTVTSDKDQLSLLRAAVQLLEDADPVDEKMFTKTVVRSMRSSNFNVHEDEVEMAAYSKASLTEKVTMHPGTTVSIFVDGVMEFLMTDIVNLIMYILPIDQLNVLISLFLLTLVSFGMIFSLVTTVTFYLGFLVMVVTTLQILKAQRAKKDVLATAKLLKQEDDKLQPQEVVSQFEWNSLAPYWSFFAALLACLPSFLIVDKGWVPCSEFTTISFGLSIACLFYLADVTEPVVCFSIAIDVLSSLPHLLAGFPYIPLVTWLLELLTDTWFTLEIAPRFLLHISIPALGKLILPFLLYQMASKNSWQGAYRVVLPLCINFAWFEMGVLFFTNSSWIGLARGSFGWLGVILLSPFIAIGGLFGTIYYIITNFSFSLLLQLVLAFLLLSTLIGLSLWKDAGYGLGSLSLRGKSLRAKIMTVLIPVLLLGSFMVVVPDESESEPKYVSWDLYRELCSRPAWEKSNTAVTQVNCEVLKYMDVNWTGQVKDIKVTNNENPADSFFDVMPSTIREWLKCLYGEKYKACDPEVDKLGLQCQVDELREYHERGCHMREHSTYTFSLEVIMQLDEDSQQTFALSAGHSFKEILLELRPGDRVNFVATINDKAGLASPKMTLHNLECLSCPQEQTQQADDQGEAVTEQIMDGLLEAVTVFTFPLLQFQ